MKITFYKDNLIPQEYKLELSDILTEFNKSKFVKWEKPFQYNFLAFLFHSEKGTHDVFTQKEWEIIYKNYLLTKNKNNENKL